MAPARTATALEAEPGSTIFADGITDLDSSLVMKLLDPVRTSHFEQASKATRPSIPSRIIAAVNLDAATHVGLRQHIENFVYKLGVVVLKVPPLRERPEDLLPLAKTLLSNIRIENHRHRLHFSPQAAAEIMRYQWPGNFGELRETIERGAMSAYHGVVTLKKLPNTRYGWADPSNAAVRAASLKEVERDHIVRILSQSSTLMDAARTLGIDMATLWRKRKRYKIDYCCP
jgi:NtrC-family two-component system response regulator AlgB